MTDKLKTEALFGKGLEGITHLIITPVTTIYNQFKQDFQSEYKGWWMTGYIDERTAIVKSPIGEHSEDCVYFAPKMRSILLLGLCGSCNPYIKIGDLFTAESTQRESDIVQAGYVYDDVNYGKIYQVKTLHEQEDPRFIKTMRSIDVDCIDMETFSIFSLAKQRSCSFGSLYVVTDNLINRPFYSINDDENEKIKQSISDLGNRVDRWRAEHV